MTPTQIDQTMKKMIADYMANGNKWETPQQEAAFQQLGALRVRQMRRPIKRRRK